MDASEMAWRILAAVILLLLSALFSGLTLGLLGLDLNELEIIAEAGEPTDKAYAKAIMPVRARGNLLLCTLVFGNVAVISSQSILMADLIGEGLSGFLVSTILTVIFGEIVPQALCSKYALYVGAKTTPLVRFLMFLLFPVAAPLAFVLDKAMGAEIGTYYSKLEILKLIRMHATQGALHPTEAGIIGGAITYRETRCKAVMTPVARMFSLSEHDRLDYVTMALIFRTGFSRVPVFNDARTAVVGILLTKDLLLISPFQAHPVAAVLAFFNRTSVITVDDEDTLETALKTFMTTRQHFGIVREVDASGPGDPVYRIAGCVTLEDILEEILGQEILDETDTARATLDSGASGERGGFTHAETSTAAAREAVLRAAYDDALAAEEGAGGSTVPGSALGTLASAACTPMEVRAIAAHLLANCAPFMGAYAPEAVEVLVRRSRVIDAVAHLPPLPPGVPPSKNGMHDLTHLRPLVELYKRGAASGEGEACCTVILQGEVNLVSGEDSIESVAGPWDILAPRALVAAGYRPDFSALPRTPIARVLRISASDFAALKRGELPLAPVPPVHGAGVAHPETALGVVDRASAGKAAQEGRGGSDPAYVILHLADGDGAEAKGFSTVGIPGPRRSGYAELSAAAPSSPVITSRTLRLPTRGSTPRMIEGGREHLPVRDPTEW
jgi:metal transporter CNNM